MGWRENYHHKGTDPFDPVLWTREIEGFAAEIQQYDPLGGCWDWVQQNLADKWQALMTAMQEIDRNFQKQSAGRLHESISRARRLYQGCVNAWNRKIP